MSFYNKPWNAGYALPAYAEAEDPLVRGSAKTTPWAPRGTISKVPPGSKLGGYAVPAYVRAEPVGSQAKTTPWLARGTFDGNVTKLKTGLPYSEHSLASNGLGALGSHSSLSGNTVAGSSVGGSNPIESYGQKAAAAILFDFKNIPLGKRDEALRELLGQIDPKLYSAAKKAIKEQKAMGLKGEKAEKAGLATAFTHGLTKEFMKLGKGRKPVAPGLKNGQVALGALVGFEAQADNYQDLGGLLSDIKSTLKKIGGYACDVATHPITPIAAGAAGAYYGGPQGASTATAGAGVAAAACSIGKQPAPGPAYAPQGGGMPVWALPAIIGGGALALIFALKK